MNIDRQIQAIRQKNNLTQERLASDLAVSRQAVSKWESGRAIPDIENLMYISDLYGVSLDELVKGDERVVRKVMADNSAKKWHRLNLLFFAALLCYLAWFGVAHSVWHVGLAVAAFSMIVIDFRLLVRR